MYIFKIIRFTFCLFVATAFINCNGQKNSNGINSSIDNNPDRLVGGYCDGCELMYIGMPENIKSTDTSLGWYQSGQKLLITGTIYKADGKTPSPNVILYYYHTDINGYYPFKDGLDERVARHGYIRGWVKSDDAGRYSIYTVRPAPYSNATMPAHIHPTIKEPNIKNEYYIDEFVFDDDKFLTSDKRMVMENRGGSGILRVLLKGNLQIAEHNIILGLNVPDYPKPISNKIKSGRKIGEESPSFTPLHAWGPDKGTKTCPVCKYGRYLGILYFVAENSNWNEIKSWLSFLEKESIKRNKYLKVYFVFSNKGESEQKIIRKLEKVGNELKLKTVALTFVPSFLNIETDVYLNKINPKVENTFIIYKNRVIIDKFINLKPTKENFEIIFNVLNKTNKDFFDLQEPKHD